MCGRYNVQKLFLPMKIFLKPLKNRIEEIFRTAQNGPICPESCKIHFSCIALGIYNFAV